jgi:leucyl/phenylalanyl-tRNA--protein transferase
MKALSPELIIRAYCQGIFPMGDDSGEINWYSPDPRCIIDLEDFRPSRRLMRTFKNGPFEIRVDADWKGVLEECANRDTTWITEPIFDVYTQLHEMGLAHTVEAYENGKLVGGLYGVSLRGAFMGESMFHTATNASKVCLVALVERMRERGFTLLDCQYMTDHLRTFGAKLIPRSDYLRRLERALQIDAKFI